MRKAFLAFVMVFVLTSCNTIEAQSQTTQSWLPFYGRSTTGCSFETCNLNPVRHQDLIDMFGDTEYHPYPAIDFGLPYGFPVRATADGEVVLTGHETEDNPDAFPRKPGRFVVLSHSGGPLSTYKHLSRTLVSVGETVVLGQVIGLAGNTQSPNVHLHFDRQNLVQDFNLYSNQTGLGRIYYRNGSRVVSIGQRIATRSVITSNGWSSAPFVVSNEAQLRRAITTINSGSMQGPFIVRVHGTVILSSSLGYLGDDLLIIEGPGTLVSPVGQRVLTSNSSGPIELKGVSMRSRGNQIGSLVYSSAGRIVINGAHLSGPGPRVVSDIEVERIT